MAARCFDDPAAVLEKEFCLKAVSKNLKGSFSAPHPKVHSCMAPGCKTLRVTQTLKFDVPGVDSPCDSPLARHLGGQLVIEKLASAFDQDGNHRGFHAGDFVWTGVAGVKGTGRISGMTNEGTHRKPVFDDCQKCDTHGVMEGRLCGEFTAPGVPELNGAQIMAAYRIRFDPTTNGPSGGATATLEGVIISPCTS